jgi:hypothetical protein
MKWKKEFQREARRKRREEAEDDLPLEQFTALVNSRNAALRDRELMAGPRFSSSVAESSAMGAARTPLGLTAAQVQASKASTRANKAFAESLQKTAGNGYSTRSKKK